MSENATKIIWNSRVFLLKIFNSFLCLNKKVFFLQYFWSMVENRQQVCTIIQHLYSKASNSSVFFSPFLQKWWSFILNDCFIELCELIFKNYVWFLFFIKTLTLTKNKIISFWSSRSCRGGMWNENCFANNLLSVNINLLFYHSKTYRLILFYTYSRA